MNVKLFKYYQALNGDDSNTTAKALQIHPVTLSKKVNGNGTDFTRHEIALLKARWCLTDEQCTQVFYQEVKNGEKL